MITDIARVVTNLEKIWGKGVDVEWALAGGTLFVLQCRPITKNGVIEKRKINTQYGEKGRNWVLRVSHQSDLLTQDLILSGIYRHCDFSSYGLSFKFPYIKYEHGTGDIYFERSQVEELKKIDLSVESFKFLINFLKTELSIYEQYLKELPHIDVNDFNCLDVVVEFFNKSIRSASTVPYFNFELCLYNKLLNEGIEIKDIKTSKTETILASDALFEIYSRNKKEFAKIRKGEVPRCLLVELERFCDKYGYLGMLYFKGNPWTISDAYRMLLDVVKNKNRKVCLTPVKVEGEYSMIASELLRLRTLKWELMCKGGSIFKKLFENNISKTISYQELLSLRINEVIGIVDGRLPLENMEAVRQNFTLEILNDGVELVLGEVKHEVARDFTGEDICGVVACEGKVKGRAKIVLTPRDGYKLLRGDVLVTKMSTPDFLPIMERASAFVTDIGGITSHAAIVSRELGKPCIIGTKNATKILEDGDLIEVDAFVGRVKVL